MALEPYDPEIDDLDPKEQFSGYETLPHPQPEERVAELPDAEQDWTEVHPNASKRVI